MTDAKKNLSPKNTGQKKENYLHLTIGVFKITCLNLEQMYLKYFTFLLVIKPKTHLSCERSS
jgi:hypothetical protein